MQKTFLLNQVSTRKYLTLLPSSVYRCGSFSRRRSGRNVFAPQFLGVSAPSGARRGFLYMSEHGDADILKMMATMAKRAESKGKLAKRAAASVDGNE